MWQYVWLFFRLAKRGVADMTWNSIANISILVKLEVSINPETRQKAFYITYFSPLHVTYTLTSHPFNSTNLYPTYYIIQLFKKFFPSPLLICAQYNFSPSEISGSTQQQVLIVQLSLL
jgi:hypothetical protein